ncbi:MAG: hypothetical protein QS748_13030 [Candidatus Endonucleobacter bathymodioli]|uniref:Uncharacterized protein n=1 Tax=Candidatus Endonucleibacter bathymodioli TaxID=539814 RepID=A0AA90P2S7_9GAMM|nr:hypothetical protein [Candidatus Endonucleobacter bathymodioli]
MEFNAFVVDGEMSYLVVPFPFGEQQVIKRVNENCMGSIHDERNITCSMGNDDLYTTHDSYYIMTTSKQNKVSLYCPPEFYGIFNTIAKNMSKHTGKKYMKIQIGLYHDISKHKMALNWHRDWWEHMTNNPDFLAFAVLDMTLPNDNIVSSHAQIALGFIDEDHAYLYTATRSGVTNSPSYKPEHEFVFNLSSMLKCRFQVVRNVQPLKELNNFTGSGYIVDQSMKRDDCKKIVHCRQVRPYEAERLTMIVRCFSAYDENEMNNDSEYKKVKNIGDENTYIAVMRNAAPCAWNTMVPTRTEYSHCDAPH